MEPSQSLEQVLHRNKHNFHPVIPENLLESGIHKFDFTANNKDIALIDLSQKHAYSHYIENELKRHHARTGIGAYNEDRLIYQRSELFGKEKEARSVHLGLDIWCDSGTPVFTPLDATVHSFKNNHTFGDYGPTIILTHQLGRHVFHTLYGHLSMESLRDLSVGKKFSKGDHIADFGNYEENGQWPPHLHFQVVIDMEGYTGDYPGVCKPANRDHYLKNCPDPQLILNIDY